MKNKMLSVLCASLMISVIFSNVSADYNTGDDMDLFIDSFGNKNMVWREQVDGIYQVFYGYEIVDTIYNQNNVTYYNETINENIDFDDGYLTIQNCNINGNLEITQAQVLVENCDINGNVKLTFGSLIFKSSNINGNIDVKNADLELRTSYVNGNVKTKTNTEDSYSVIITDNDINGNVDLKSGICYIVGNTINGNLKVKDPAIIQEVSDNEVNGNTQMTDNTSGFNGIQITNSSLHVMYPQVAIDSTSGMGYTLWVENSSGTSELWYTISPDMILWLEPHYGGILTYTAGNPELDMEAINGTLYVTWKEGGELTIAPDYSEPPALQVVGMNADRPVVHMNEPATILLKMNNTGNGSALYTAVKVTNIVGDNETLIDTSEIGILRPGMENIYEFSWTPVKTGIHYLKVEMQGKYITHHSPTELVEGSPTIMSIGFPVSPQADTILLWGPDGFPVYHDNNTINLTTDPSGIREISGSPSNQIEIRVYEGLTIEATCTLKLNEYVTLVMLQETTWPSPIYGITIQPAASFVISSPSRTTTIQSPSSTPSYTYPFLNSGTVDFLGANVTYTYGPSDLALAGGIQNKPGSTCNLTDCHVEFADTHSIMANNSRMRIDGSETIIGKGNNNQPFPKGSGVTVIGNSNVVVENVTVEAVEESGIRCVDADNITVQGGVEVRYSKSNGILLENSDAIIIDSSIHDNAGDGIQCIDAANPIINGTNTNISWNSGNGIYAEGALPLIDGITVQHNYADGIVVKNIYNSGGQSCGVVNSTICYNHGSGISLDSTDIEVAYNNIYENGQTSLFSDTMMPYSGPHDSSLRVASASGVTTFTRLATSEDIKSLKEVMGVYNESTQYNQTIDGHGTGLIPPTEEEWDSMTRTLNVVEDIISQQQQLNSSVDHSLSPHFPPIGQQYGSSCVAWATTYYTKTFQEAKEHGWDLSGANWTDAITGPSVEYQDRIMSPYFTYNLINDGIDGGSMFGDALDTLSDIGVSSWSKMPPSSASAWPDEEAWREAPMNRGYGYSILPFTDTAEIESLKTWLSAGNLAIIHVAAGNYTDLDIDKNIWTIDNYDGTGGGSHANTIVGYNDNYSYTENGVTTCGAFRIANSWGPTRHNEGNGKFWISYEAMKVVVKYAYIYEDRIGYDPQLLAVFNISHPSREYCSIEIGSGNHEYPDSIKSFATKGGSHPIPSNNIALDITELIYSQGMNMFVKLHGGTYTGAINNFSIEYFEEYSSNLSTSRQVLCSADPIVPYNATQNIPVYAELNLTLTGYDNWVFTGLWHRVKAEPGAPTWNISYEGDWSWWFGDDDTGNYDKGTVCGSVSTSNKISLLYSTTAYLSFWSWYETDTIGIDTDQRWIIVQNETASKSFQLNGDEMHGWARYIMNISEFSGSNVSITFYFDTINSKNNTYLGWYIDLVEIFGKYPSLEDGYGITMTGNSTAHVHNNNIFINALDGIYLSDTVGATLEANHVKGQNIGIAIVDSLSNIIKNNVIINNEYGIYLDYSFDNDLIGNEITGNDYGGYLRYSCNNSVEDNTISSNINQGLIFDYSDTNLLINCSVTNNLEGINFGHCKENNIRGNNISYNSQRGVKLNFSNNNSIIDNTIAYDNYQGLFLSYSIDNTIERNELSNNNLGIGAYWNCNRNSYISNLLYANNKGIYQISSSECNFTDNLVTDNFYGIEILLRGGNILSANYLQRNYCGVYITSSSNNIIIDNNVSLNAGVGIQIGSSVNNTLVNNTVSSNDMFGIYLFNADSNVLTRNVMNDNGLFILGSQLQQWNTHSIDTTNTVNGKPVHYLKNCIAGVVPSGAGEVILANCTDIFVQNQNVSDGSVGLLLGFSNNNTLDNNTVFSNAYQGISLYESDNNMITSNKMSNNRIGLFQNACENNTIISNSIFNNTNGLVLSNSRITHINNNTVNCNEVGISIGDSKNNNVVNNIIAYNNYGIHLNSFSECNSVSGNTIKANIIFGIYLEDSYSNEIYYNNFIDNINQAFDNSGTNVWDNGYPSGGNYWSEYAGIDVMSGPTQDDPGSDGISDAPYTNIGGCSGSQDYYPLMTEISLFSIPILLGWNLISIPVDPGNHSIPYILSSIHGQWDVVKYCNTTDVADPWKTYRIGGTANDLFFLDWTMGFWLYVTDTGTGFLTVNGRAPTVTTIVLHEGWNLVGYPSFCETMTVANALWGTGADHVEVFDASSPYLQSEVGPTYLMKPGEGYWVHVPVDSMWTIDW